MIVLELVFVLGLCLLGMPPLPAHRPLGQLLLQLARVEQHQRGQLDRAVGGVDRPAIALVDDVRDEAAVVEVGVRQQDGVDIGRVIGKRYDVACARAGQPLEEPAVDDDAGAIGLD